MNKSVFITLMCMLGTIASLQARVIIDPETDQETRCGGPLEADEGSLTFPAAGQVAKPGEVCIWTIHLQTTATFRLNFTNLDIIGNDDECADGSVRLYSLTNLIPADRAESYTFCNNQPPADGNFFLSENLLTVVYHSDEGSNNAGEGFTLNWQGIAVQPIPKIHQSTYTSATSGLIRYPVEGQYAPNQVDTWLVKGWDVDPNLKLHVTVPYVNLETCDKLPAEDCLCDALILYEVSQHGILTENMRMCGNVSDVDISNIGPNIILGFFTDHLDDEESGRGFELIYRPEPGTTRPPTTQPPPVSNVSTSCGGLVYGTQGRIDYKVGTTYELYERCIWTVRTPLLSQIRFTVNEMGMEANYDRVTVYPIRTSGELGQAIVFTPGTAREVVAMGSVAVLVFHTDHSIQGTGFSLTFEGEGPGDGEFDYYTDFNPSIGSNPWGILKHPEEGVYRNSELSTFVLARPSNSPYSQIGLNITSIDLEMNSQGGCKDKFHVYYVNHFEASSLSRLTPTAGVCQTSHMAAWIMHESIVMVMSTDQEGTANGFEVEWLLG